MKLDRAVKLKMDGKNRIYDIYSAGRIYKMTSHDIHQKYLDFKESLPNDTPYWVISYFNGLSDCCRDSYYSHDLHFGYWINGVLYSVHRDNPMFYGKHGIKPSELCDKSSGHYWIGNDNKPFFENLTK